MATHSSVLVWRIPWTEGPGGLQSMGVAESRTRLSNSHTHTHTHTQETKGSAGILQTVAGGLEEGENLPTNAEKVLNESTGRQINK